jgi:hypothetical protein
MRRYVVLRHDGVPEPHFDFMFDTADDSPLVVFRLAQWPLEDDQPVIKLNDHRRLYLTYEGEIPGDRGRVDRIADGQLDVSETASGWLLQNADGTLYALFEPQREDSGDAWWVTLPAP